jgi:hypothetical protein
LIDDEMVVKLCDFGWCSDASDTQRNVLCGTYEYMAPEVLARTRYSEKLDIWSLGVLAFELLHKYTPFKAPTVEGISKNIQTGVYSIDSGVSKHFRDFIISTLDFNPYHRPSAKQLLAHPLFTSIAPLYVSDAPKLKRMNPTDSMHEAFNNNDINFSLLGQYRGAPNFKNEDLDSTFAKNLGGRAKEESAKKGPEALDLTKYNPDPFEVDFEDRKQLTLDNLDDYFEFDIDLGQVFRGMKTGGEQVIGFFGNQIENLYNSMKTDRESLKCVGQKPEKPSIKDRQKDSYLSKSDGSGPQNIQISKAQPPPEEEGGFFDSIKEFFGFSKEQELLKEKLKQQQIEKDLKRKGREIEKFLAEKSGAGQGTQGTHEREFYLATKKNSGA